MQKIAVHRPPSRERAIVPQNKIIRSYVSILPGYLGFQFRNRHQLFPCWRIPFKIFDRKGKNCPTKSELTHTVQQSGTVRKKDDPKVPSWTGWHGIPTMPAVSHMTSLKSKPIHGVFTTCMAMYGSFAPISQTITKTFARQDVEGSASPNAGAMRGGAWMNGTEDCRSAVRMISDDMFGGAGFCIAVSGL